MPDFGRVSRRRLESLHPRLARVCWEVVAIYDITILETYRSNERQAQLLAEGKTTLGPGKSMHNRRPSLAVDVAPWHVNHIPWDDPKPFIFMAGHFFQAAYQEGIKIRWGGNWDGDLIIIDDQNFDDLPHFEMVLDSDP